MTPHDVTQLLQKLSAAFQSQDVGELLNQFSTRPETTYAGSEADEIASGPHDIKALFEDLLSRDQAYSFAFRTPHIIDISAGSWILAEGTGTEHESSGDTETFEYRVTGLIVREGGRAVWLALCGYEVVPAIMQVDRTEDAEVREAAAPQL